LAGSSSTQHDSRAPCAHEAPGRRKFGQGKDDTLFALVTGYVKFLDRAVTASFSIQPAEQAKGCRELTTFFLHHGDLVCVGGDFSPHFSLFSVSIDSNAAQRSARKEFLVSAAAMGRKNGKPRFFFVEFADPADDLVGESHVIVASCKIRELANAFFETALVVDGIAT